ncbi:hypothetical protein EG348_21280 [Chryseobacterium sp. G0201]|nr:hypothetical protein EG348_21280 [Chryseobacterium sp. G0201]
MGILRESFSLYLSFVLIEKILFFYLLMDFLSLRGAKLVIEANTLALIGTTSFWVAAEAKRKP